MNGSNEIKLLITLRDQLVAFLDDLITLFPHEADFVIFRIFIKDRLPIEDIMRYIIKNLVPLKPLIEAKDEKFFLDDRNILFEKFSQVENTKVNHFRNMWLSDEVSSEEKQSIWKWFTLLVTIAERYQKIKTYVAS